MPHPAPAERPLGHAGKKQPAPDTASPPVDYLPVQDRWRIGFPEWDRYAHDHSGAAPYVKGRKGDPYRQNVLKGDYPILGNATFLNLTLLSDTLADVRRIPTASGISAAGPGREGFFGDGDQLAASSKLLISADLFHGAAAFRPVDWRVRLTPVLDINYLDVQERGVVNIDVREGTQRTDEHLGFQEAFGELKLLDVSPYYDVMSIRLGIQGFVSDFRGFLFADNEPGVRLFGTWASNRTAWNVTYFDMVEKDTNSLLNTLDSRDQRVWVANLYRQDFIWLGYTASLSVHLNLDNASVHFDENGFLVRPAAIGSLQPHEIDVTYMGWTGSGHVGRLNLTHQIYYATGDDTENPVAGRAIDVDAWMAALELSVDRDWWRPRLQIFWSSGDGDPRDDRGEGFDTIFDNPFFAGAGSSFWVRQAIPLTGTKVRLVSESSLVPNLRPSKEEGQANFVNPGLRLLGAGVDVEITPRLKGTANLNLLSFDDTSSLELLLFQSGIDRDLGIDVGLGVQWRPYLNNNLLINATASTFLPGAGFKDIYTEETLFSIFGSVTLVY